MPRKEKVLVLYIVQGDLQRQAEKERQASVYGGEASCRLWSSGVGSGFVWDIVGVRAVVRGKYCGGRGRAGALRPELPWRNFESTVFETTRR